MADIERGAIRRSQAITTFGVGSLIDLPEHSAIVGGLDGWPKKKGELISEPRLAERLRRLQRPVPAQPPELIAPPAAADSFWQKTGAEVPAYLFPRWFVERRPRRLAAGDPNESTARRLLSRTALDGGKKLRFRNTRVVATRFVRACPRGHVDDLDWNSFTHGGAGGCVGSLSLEEGGTTGDLAELRVRCRSCGKSRLVGEAKESGKLGLCNGKRPWLGRHPAEDCDQKFRLLIRTATNAWFPQILSVLSLPDRRSPVERVVRDFWGNLHIADDSSKLALVKQLYADVAEALADFPDDAVLAAIQARREGKGSRPARPLKQVELDVLLDVPEGFDDDIPVDPDFHARRLRDSLWRRGTSRGTEKIAKVIQVHRLREVMALAGFTRFEAPMRDIDGEYDTDVQRAALAEDADWFPAVENRGEGVFVEIVADSVRKWEKRPAVVARVALLRAGYDRWRDGRKKPGAFPGGAYIALHTLAHLLIQSVALHCGYPAASIRERIYVDEEGGRFGVLLYTASPDSEGTLGGLVEQARTIGEHLHAALETAALCSNDPVCAGHDPGESMEERWLHGAACHGCTLIAETSCEMRNDYLDRALVAPVIGCADAALFPRRASL